MHASAKPSITTMSSDIASMSLLLTRMMIIVRQTIDRPTWYPTVGMLQDRPSTGGCSTSCDSKKYRKMCESFCNTIARLREDMRYWRSETRRLQRRLDEAKARKSLQCLVCLEEKEKWVVVQCGHLICGGYVLDLMQWQALFNKPYPSCQAPMKSLAECYPNLR
ncbi:uncharacterized protein TRUGW13939_11234 [Talaromyces rugulosus]|uniref:Uncharacterized protein n=1 Tax=Talaromyces rugulosus TaxID=121627 RepID=A0A7H8RED4_TALRU|nr:uncharacterized protein TRUGW13939_11234 [Talaromyces rugulosus]QKX64061.1 hypothetical protein TRUGW13939_11234 [Talaromyces rugulosus]